MRAEAVVEVVAVVGMFAFPLGCGSSGSGASSAGSSVATSGASSGSTTGGTTIGGTSSGATTTGGTTTGGGIRGLGAPCTYDVSSGVDTCADAGLECTSLISWVFCEGLDYPCPPTASNKGGAGTCALPQEIDTCAPSIGCQDGGPATNGESDQFACVTGLSSGEACLYTCNQTADCANISESCQNLGGARVCFYDYCDVNAQGQLVGPYFDACNAAGTGDGECLAYGGNPPFGAVCYQNGTAAQGQPCQTYRTGGSTAEQCVFGQFCAPTPADQTVGICMQLADGTANHPCSDSTAHLVVDVIGANFGVCAQDCAPDAGSCPARLTCRTLAGGKKGCLP